MTQLVIDMYNYNVWATRTLIQHLKTLPREAYSQETLSGYPSVAQTVAHLYCTEHTWLDILNGIDMNEAMTTTFPLQQQMSGMTLDEMEAAYSALSDRFQSSIEQKADLTATLLVDNPYATVRETSLSEIVLHVVTHGSYHRGNIGTMLHQLGHTGVMQDYGLYWYSGLPAGG